MTPLETPRRVVVACDLDQTLIYSRRAFRLAAGEPEPPLQVVEHLDGAPASFVTQRAANLLADLADRAELVPVTTRTRAQLARVDLGVRPRYAVAANGGHLLVDGVPDEAWAATVRRRLAGAGRPLAEVHRRAERLADPAWVRTLRVADDLFVYLVAHDRFLVPDLGPLRAELAAGGWEVSVQGRKVYLVPAALTKEAALAEVTRRVGDGPGRPVPVVAAGDALLDAGMLAAADVAVRPAHGELHAAGFALPHLQIVDVAGLVAGEAIAAALLEHVRMVTQRDISPSCAVPASA